MLQTVENAGRVLDLFTVETPERGVTEIAALLGLPKSRVHELLATLTAICLLRRTPTGRYRVGWRALALARVVSETTGFRTEARRVMETLAADTGEMIHLATLDAGRTVYVDRIEGAGAVRISSTAVGSHGPSHCCGVGKALLAPLPWPTVEAMIARWGLERRTEHTITDPDALRAELAATFERGWAIDREEALPEVCCVAAPLLADTGEAVAAISITAPAYRFRAQERRYREAVVEAARQVSARLGHHELFA